ncbi:MAG: DedA family protein [Hyphomicrobiales bacterium]|uniref:YqaA family protein n=1 Tax=Rhabdaerophilum calidifontis TaxID=2604328 RepID=UPI0012390A8E|nr:YqaA family protein [Rhabdaerophilum calidifontis]MCA1952571.1 DedA family protein [Hyphomicrobiales bacterium]MCA1998697.1 DedA family protein [Hyphomicrobiales bacterium]
MFKRLYDWTLALSASPRAPQALAAISFAESSFFPVPPDVMLVPMVMAKPERAWNYALVCTIASVLGGLAGYAIGAMLYDTLGLWLIRLYGYADKMEAFRALYQQHGHWIILIKGFTPIPFKLITIASGLAGYDLVWFVLLSLITRGARFFLVAGVMNRFGAPLRRFIEANLTAVGIISLVALVAGFAAAKLLF